MVVKVYISGISGNKEVKKRQQRVLMILDSKNIKYEIIDIAEPGRESDKNFVQNNAKSLGGTVSDPTPRSPLPPQMFNDEEYCGDYDQFDLANEVDTLEQFLKLEAPPEEPPQVETEKEKTVNGDVDEEKSKESSQERVTEPEKTEEDTADTTETPEKENSPVKESSPVKETNDEPTKESTPAPEGNENHDDAKEDSPAKETSPERQKSVEKSPAKEIEAESKEVEKESSPEKEDSLNENGTASSREQSEEKEAVAEVTEAIESKKENLSELLIESEQAASAE